MVVIWVILQKHKGMSFSLSLFLITSPHSSPKERMLAELKETTLKHKSLISQK